MSHRAYDDFRRDVLYALRPNPRASNNASVEVEAWETVRSSVDEDLSTFTVSVYNVDEVGWGTPKAIGSSYQVVGGRFKQQVSNSLLADTTTGAVISAPSQWTGQFTVSYKFSAWRALVATILWFLELLARIATVAVIVALAALFVYYMPWATIAEAGVTAVQLLRRDVPSASPTPVPTATPRGCAMAYGTSRVIVGNSPSPTPD